MCLVRFSLGTPLDGGLCSINRHRWNQVLVWAKGLIWAQGRRKEFIKQFLWDRADDCNTVNLVCLFSAQAREILERQRKVVCPVYAAKEEGSFQRKVPSKGKQACGWWAGTRWSCSPNHILWFLSYQLCFTPYSGVIPMLLPPSSILNPRNNQENSKVVSKLGLETPKDQKKKSQDMVLITFDISRIIPSQKWSDTWEIIGEGERVFYFSVFLFLFCLILFSVILYAELQHGEQPELNPIE